MVVLKKQFSYKKNYNQSTETSIPASKAKQWERVSRNVAILFSNVRSKPRKS